MSGPARENWPVKILITGMPLSILGEDIPLYHLLGTMNQAQIATLVEDGRLSEGLTSTLQLDSSTSVLSAVLTGKQLASAYEALSGPSKTWRGQYYSVTQAFVEAYRGALN
jgi:hypothetical protein